MNPLLTANLNAIKESQKQALLKELNTALPCLQNAYDAADKAGMKEQDYELMCLIGDAFDGCSKALEHLTTHELYDVATQGRPVNGKLHPPKSAF